VGLTEVTAKTAIIDAGLTVGTITEQYSDTIAAGRVMSQTPTSGMVVDTGFPINLVISLGSEI
jgi:serine/threonine-protein kinase